MTPETNEICTMLLQTLSPADMLDLASSLFMSVHLNPRLRGQLSETSKAALTQVMRTMQDAGVTNVTSIEVISRFEVEPTTPAGARSTTKH